MTFVFLHTYNPHPTMFILGPISIHWYGFLIVVGIILGFLVSLRIARIYSLKKQTVWDLYFWLVIFGLIGARLYHVFCEWQYYFIHPLDIVKVWNGGLGIYGGVIVGILVILVYSKKVSEGRGENLSFSIFHLSFIKDNKNFWLLLDILAPALILGQAIGRWGNYFNQEIFGLPTDLPWGIPIGAFVRPEAYRGFEYFHPVFLYQSLANFLIFFFLITLHWLRLRDGRGSSASSNISNNVSNSSNQGSSRQLEYGGIFLTYLILYPLSRFFLEFIRLDTQPIILGLRLGQWVSGVLMVVGVWLLVARFIRGRKLVPGG